MPRVALTSLVVVLLAAAPASARPRAHAASFPNSATVTVPPGGSAEIGSPTLPAGATQATVDVAPKDGSPLFNRLQTIFAATKSKKARLLTCVYLYAVASNATTQHDAPVSFQDTDTSLAFLFLAACAQMAAQMPASASASSAAPCRQVQRAVAITVTKPGARYRATIDAPSHRIARRLPLRIACRGRGAGVRLKVSPRARHRTLRQVVGRTLSLGFYSPPDIGGSVTVTATFQRPR